MTEAWTIQTKASRESIDYRDDCLHSDCWSDCCQLALWPRPRNGSRDYLDIDDGLLRKSDTLEATASFEHLDGFTYPCDRNFWNRVVDWTTASSVDGSDGVAVATVCHNSRTNRACFRPGELDIHLRNPNGTRVGICPPADRGNLRVIQRSCWRWWLQ